MGRVLVAAAAAAVILLPLLLLAVDEVGGDGITQLVSSYASVVGLQVVVILPFFIVLWALCYCREKEPICCQKISGRRRKNCRQMKNRRNKKSWPVNGPVILLLFSFIIPTAVPMGTTPPAHSSPHAMCLDRIFAGGGGSYSTMAVLPDGSGAAAALAGRDGVIWLQTTTMPKINGGGGGGAGAARATPFLDLRERVHHGAVGSLGIKSVAFHPEFVANGRFYVSYTCDAARSPECAAGARAAAAGGAGGGAQWSRYWLIVTEFSAKDYSMGMTKTADPKKLRTIFRMALPPPQELQISGLNNGGQLFFNHGYMYIATGHGVINTAPGNVDFSWDRNTWMGKVLRLDINHFPGGMKQAEMIAMGVGDPKGCSFHPNRRFHMYCALIVNATAEVRLIDTRRGSFTVVHRGSRTLPVGSQLPEIIGGFSYRGSDPSLKGRYIYRYGSDLWVATETLEGSDQYTSMRIAMVGCSSTSPMACDPNGTAIVGLIHFIVEGNNGDALFLTTKGIYRVVHPTLCHNPTGEPIVAGAAGDGINNRSPAQWMPITWMKILPTCVGFLASLFISWCIINRLACPGTNGGDGQQGPSVMMNNTCCNNGSFMCCIPMSSPATTDD